MSETSLISCLEKIVDYYYGCIKIHEQQPLLISVQKRIFNAISEEKMYFLFVIDGNNLEATKTPQNVTNIVIVNNYPKNFPAHFQNIRFFSLLDFFDFVTHGFRNKKSNKTALNQKSAIRASLPRINNSPAWSFITSLLGNSKTSNRIIIKGKEKSGKTELLKSIYNSSQKHLNLIPIFIPKCESNLNHQIRELLTEEFDFLASLKLKEIDFLLRSFSPRIVLLVDEIQPHMYFDQFLKGLFESGISIICTSKYDQEPTDLKNWQTYELDEISHSNIFDFIETNFSNKIDFQFKPTLQFVKSFNTYFELKLLVEKNLLESIKGTLLSQNIEPFIFENIWKSWLAVNFDKKIKLDLFLNFCAKIIIENRLNQEPINEKNLKYLSSINLSRIPQKPIKKVHSEKLLTKLKRAPFVLFGESGSIQFSNKEVEDNILSEYIFNQIITTSSNKENNSSIPIPKILEKELLGNGFLLPILGLLRLSENIIHKISILIKPENLGKVKNYLIEIIEYSKKNSFYSITPWKYLAGNALSIYSIINDGKISLDLNGARIAGVSLKNINCIEASFIGAYMRESNLSGAIIHPNRFLFAYLVDSIIDPEDYNGMKSLNSIWLDIKDECIINKITPLLDGSNEILIVPNDETDIVDPVLIRTPVLGTEFMKFIKNNNEYSKAQYLNNHLNSSKDTYYLSDFEELVNQGSEILHIGLDAAMACANFMDGRIPCLNEYLKYAKESSNFGDITNNAEWLWDLSSISIGVYQINNTPIQKNKFPSLEKYQHSKWSGLVVELKNENVILNRILPLNCNSDVTFRVVFDYIGIIKRLNLQDD